MSDIKVKYISDRDSGTLRYQSTAYVSEEPDQFNRHVGTDKYTDEKVYVVWYEDKQAWYEEPETVTDREGFVWANHGGYTDDRLTFGSEHERGLLEMVKSMLPEGGTFVDIGAHVGLYTINLANKAAEILAIEANPVTHGVFKKNLALNNDKHNCIVTAANFAAWDEYVPNLLLVDESKMVSGGSTHCEAPGDEGYGPRYDSGLTTDGLSVDYFVEQNLPHLNVDLVKIDVEGAEAKVLKGMSATITRCQPILQIEMHDIVYGLPNLRAEVFEILESLDYEWNEDIRLGDKCYYLFARPKEEFAIEVVKAGDSVASDQDVQKIIEGMKRA